MELKEALDDSKKEMKNSGQKPQGTSFYQAEGA